MSVEYQKHKKVSLREVGKDEKWLQDQIEADPSILGLGDLTLFGRQWRQPAGGRLDILLSDTDNDTLYEVEIMLGATDPSHIIRTIEYWDVESRRYPNQEHRAVIVAEEITKRFFNVIWLLNRSLPIIAIQLNALTVNGNLLLHFTKVLDIYVAQELGNQPDETVNREYWERRSSPAAMALFDRFMKLLSDQSLPLTATLRHDGIALSGKSVFAMIYPKKSGFCTLRSYGETLPEDVLNQSIDKLEANGATVRELAGGRYSVRLDNQAMDRNADVLIELVRSAVKTVDGN